MTATADAVSAQRVSAGTFAPSDATVGFGFDFYGVGLIVTSGSTALVDGVARDFEYFAGAPPASRIVVRGHASPPPWERIPARLASMVTPNAVTYDDGGLRYNDYQRRALAIYDFATEHGDVWSEDADLLYEIVYLMALSRVGERHDLLGIHRLHALGVAIDGRAALVLLPEAGGKSTLALELLRRPEIRLLSDDTPLARGDRVLAFPTRIGVRAGGVAGVAPADLRTVRPARARPQDGDRLPALSRPGDRRRAPGGRHRRRAPRRRAVVDRAAGTPSRRRAAPRQPGLRPRPAAGGRVLPPRRCRRAAAQERDHALPPRDRRTPAARRAHLPAGHGPGRPRGGGGDRVGAAMIASPRC